MATDRDEMFRDSAAALAAWAEELMGFGDAFLLSSPGGELTVPYRGPEVERSIRMLRELEAAMPLERSPEDAVWETLQVSRGGSYTWVTIVNAIGGRDRVTTVGHPDGGDSDLENWCRCRELSADADTSWDEARRTRRIVDWGGEATLIDRGANRIIEIAEAFGATTLNSCEGHPHGAYLHFVGGDVDALVEGFREAGWRVMRNRDDVAAYMPRPRSVGERDANWRATCAVVEAKLSPPPSP